VREMAINKTKLGKKRVLSIILVWGLVGSGFVSIIFLKFGRELV
jgi:hypothetical protein